MPCVNFSKELKACAAVNNIGVSLLEMECFEQAASTLRDATSIMKLVYSTSFEPSNHQQVANNIDCSGMIDRANKRRSQPIRSAHAGAVSFSVTNLADSYCDQAFHYDKQDAMMEDSSICAIRIDDVGSNVNTPCCLSNPDIQTAVILHNFAVACLCVAAITMPTSSLQGQKRMHEAVKLFELSNSILERCMDDTVEDEEEGDELFLRQMASLNIAVLDGIMKALQLQGVSLQQLGGILDRLNYLHETVEMADEVMSCWYNVIDIVAAPAA